MPPSRLFVLATLVFGTTITSPCFAFLIADGSNKRSFPLYATSCNNAAIDTTFISPTNRDLLTQWLHTLTSVQRSEPFWVGQDILAVSPSQIVQQHLNSLCSNQQPIALFTAQQQDAFDEQWRTALLTLLPPEERISVLEQGMSNTHPLRLQLVACPPNCDFTLHVHAAVELDIPIVGDLHERRVLNKLLDKRSLCRSPQHQVGKPAAPFQQQFFSDKPTRDELQIIQDDLNPRILMEECGQDGSFVDRVVPEGQALVNEVGSIHQSYTTNDGCLLWVLGANVHAHFLPGNFRQRTGIESLWGIEDLLLDNDKEH